jgi:hypothetical protein
MPCIAYEELVTSMDILKENFRRNDAETPADRLEWMLRRHDTDGSEGCDWCLMAEEIRRLRIELRGFVENV